MQLSKQDQVFRTPSIFHVDPKTIDLERVLINLFMLMKYDGHRPISRKRSTVTTDSLLQKLITTSEVVEGFERYPEIAAKWIESDVVDMVFRGNPNREAIVAPRPLHLDSYKQRNPNKIRDYNASDQIFSMLNFTDPALLNELKHFLGTGLKDVQLTDSDYDNKIINKLDLITLVIMRLVQGQELVDQKGRSPQSVIRPPLLGAQAALMCDDIRRLLAYKDKMPRHILIEYVKVMMGIHLALYALRLFNELPRWVRDKHAPDSASDVFDPIAPNYSEAFSEPLELLVDMTDNSSSRMGYLSVWSATQHYDRINDYIRAVFAVNVLIPYAATTPAIDLKLIRQDDPPIRKLINLLAKPPITFQGYFVSKLNGLFADEAADHVEKPEVLAIKEMDLSEYEKYVELITQERSKFHRDYLTELLDACSQKNTEAGLLVQSQGRKRPRRFHLGSRLLEILVQLAVLEETTAGNYRTRVIRVNEFIDWLRLRYGFVINGLDSAYVDRAELIDNEAFLQNIQALKDRLREIGFYTDLSDASNAQTLRPRYKLDYV